MKLSEIRDVLLTVGVPVFHYFGKTKEDKYIVWAEDNESGSLKADDEVIEQEIQGTIDYFTREEFDENVLKIQQALNSANIPFRLNSVQHEDDTNFVHFEWTFEVIFDG